jgi:hypothetical protein
MEIKEMQLDKAKCANWAMLMKPKYMDQNAVNCQLKVLKCDSATLSIAYRSCASVDWKLTSHKAFGCNLVFVYIVLWLPIMAILLFIQND